MPDIRNLYLSLPDLTNRLCKISNRLRIMRSSLFFLAREYCVLETMHEIIQKGPNGYDKSPLKGVKTPKQSIKRQ
ncbi:hypothetical protein ACLGE2_02250 [Helicobacter pylori]|nr:hypothetical protein [Helicobacter pylori]